LTTPSRRKRTDAAVWVGVLLLLGVSAEVLAAPRFDAQTQKQLRQVLRDQLPFKAGVSVAIDHEGKSFTAAFGLADVDNKVKATTQTRYRMASVTKSFTAALVMQQVERGTIDLDADVRTYVKSFPQKPWPVTIRQLLGHLGGISHYKNLPGEKTIQRHMTTRESLALFENWPLVAEPGSKYVYTSYGYNLLGAVLEKVTKTSYATLLQRRLFRPLKMRSSSMDKGRDKVPHQPVGYKQNAKGELTPSPFVDISSRFAGGGTRSTVLDMVKFGRGMLDGDVVKPATRDLMFTSQATSNGHLTDYGMGFAAYPSNGRWIVAHSGAQPETSTLLLMVPDDDLVIAIACNVEDQWRVLQTMSKILIAYALDDGERVRGLAANDVVDQIQLSGLTKVTGHGLAHFRRFQQPLATSDAHVLRAFARVRGELARDVVTADAEAAVFHIQEGFHPVHGRDYAVVGAHMASVLHDAGIDVRRFHRQGPLAFAAAYNDVCQQRDCPQALMLTALEDDVARMLREQQKADPLVDSRFIFTQKTKLALVQQKLQKLADVVVKPDFSDELGRRAVRLALTRKAKKAQGYATLNAKLYPNREKQLFAQVQLGVLLDKRGDADLGMTSSTMAEYSKLLRSVQGPQMLTAGRVKWTALNFRRRGFALGSLRLLHLAAQGANDDVVMQDAACQQALKLREKTAASACRRAQELSPTAKRAKRLRRSQAL